MKAPRRYIIRSDDHELHGRVYDLARPVQLGFESYEAAKECPCALYVWNVDRRVTLLSRRVESLNVVGTMLWTRNLPRSFIRFPISRYEWLNAIADILLMRLISVSDCAALLTNEVFQCGINPRRCTIDALRKKGVPATVIGALNDVGSGHLGLRAERNYRFHHGVERRFSDDDTIFRTLALHEHRYRKMRGTDQHGREVDVRACFRQGLMELKAEFVPATRGLYRNLTRLYDLLSVEFEPRFSTLFRSRTKPLPW